MIACTLPWPPTTNNLYRTAVMSDETGTVIRRVSTAVAISYRKAVGDQVLIACIPRHTLEGKRVAVSITLFAEIKTGSYDIDNRVKAVLDALQANGVLANDSQVDKLEVTRGAPGAAAVLVAITEIDQRGVAASTPLPLKDLNRETSRTGPAPRGRRVKGRARALSRVAVASGREPRGDG